MGTECGNGEMLYVVGQSFVSHRFVLKESL